MNTRAMDMIALYPETTSEERKIEAVCIEVTVFWNDTVQEVIEIEPDKHRQADFHVGEEPSCQFMVPSEVLLGRTRFELASLKGGVLSTAWMPGMGFRVTTADGRVKISMDGGESDLESEPLSELIGPRDIAEISFGSWVFRVRMSQKLARVKTPLQLDRNATAFLGVSGLLHAVILGLMFLVPPDAWGFATDKYDENSRFMKIMLTPPEIHQAPVPEIPEDAEETVEEPGGKAHAGVMGQMGDRNEKKTRNRSAIKGPPDNRDPRMQRELLKEMAQNQGVLSFLTAQKMPLSPFGEETAQGFDVENALGDLTGDRIGPNFGFDGLGPSGTGRGGGGDGRGTIGVGRLGTISFTTGTGRGIHPRDTGVGGLKGRRSKGPEIRSQPATVKGSLSKDTIRRIIHRRINEIRFCYEKGLMKRPDISGRVAVRFIIAGTGAVQNAVVASSTIGDPGVEMCIANAVRRLTFPMPTDGGVVIVTYPFSLTSSQTE